GWEPLVIGCSVVERSPAHSRTTTQHCAGSPCHGNDRGSVVDASDEDRDSAATAPTVSELPIFPISPALDMSVPEYHTGVTARGNRDHAANPRHALRCEVDSALVGTPAPH